MALEGTHIRFALDVSEKYQVKDLAKYLAGAIYPDSRYMTKINRELTHPHDYRNWDVMTIDDFRKGWFVHLLYDDLQFEVMSDNFPELAEIGPQWSESWIKRSSVKNLQDISDMREVDIKPYLHWLEYAENPNHEDLNIVKNYNKHVQDMYASGVDIQKCVDFWQILIQNETMANKIKSISEEFSKDLDFMGRVKKIYNRTIEKFHDQQK